MPHTHREIQSLSSSSSSSSSSEISTISDAGAATRHKGSQKGDGAAREKASKGKGGGGGRRRDAEQDEETRRAAGTNASLPDRRERGEGRGERGSADKVWAGVARSSRGGR